MSAKFVQNLNIFFLIFSALVVRLFEAHGFSREVKFPTSDDRSKNERKSVTDGKGEIRIPGSVLTEMPDDVVPGMILFCVRGI